MLKKLSDDDLKKVSQELLNLLDKRLFLNTITYEQIEVLASIIASSIILTATKSASITSKENTAILLNEMTQRTIDKINFIMQKTVSNRYDMIKD